MGTQVKIASADALVARELGEQLAHAGFTPTDAAELVVEDMPASLRVGAQMLEKPLRLRTLLSVLRSQGTQKTPLKSGWQFDAASRMLMHPQASAVELTEKEAELLSALLSHAECDRASLLEEVWGYGEGISTRTLETHMYRLRSKLKQAFAGEDPVETTASGYRLAV